MNWNKQYTAITEIHVISAYAWHKQDSSLNIVIHHLPKVLTHFLYKTTKHPISVKFEAFTCAIYQFSLKSFSSNVKPHLTPTLINLSRKMLISFTAVNWIKPSFLQQHQCPQIPPRAAKPSATKSNTMWQRRS